MPTIMMEITIDRDMGNADRFEDAEVEYHTEGKAHPDVPVESPRIVIDNISVYDNGTREFSEWQFSSKEWHRIQDTCREDFEAKQGI